MLAADEVVPHGVCLLRCLGEPVAQVRVQFVRTDGSLQTCRGPVWLQDPSASSTACVSGQSSTSMLSSVLITNVRSHRNSDQSSITEADRRGRSMVMGSRTAARTGTCSTTWTRPATHERSHSSSRSITVFVSVDQASSGCGAGVGVCSVCDFGSSEKDSETDAKRNEYRFDDTDHRKQDGVIVGGT